MTTEQYPLWNITQTKKIKKTEVPYLLEHQFFNLRPMKENGNLNEEHQGLLLLKQYNLGRLLLRHTIQIRKHQLLRKFIYHPVNLSIFHKDKLILV